MVRRRGHRAADNLRGVRDLIISLPHQVIAAVLFVVFCIVSATARRLVMRRFDAEVRDELAEQANNLLTGVSATFAFFIGFAISISWGAVTAAQSAVEDQAANIQRMAWEIQNVSDKSAAANLTEKLTSYARAAADQDAPFLARGMAVNLPSAAALDDFEDALHAYADGPGSAVNSTTGLLSSASSLVSSAASVSAVANRAIPRPLVALLFIVGLLVTIILGISTVASGRASMMFIYIWCLIPALSLAVVLALAFPFALRSGMPLAPIRAVAQSLSGG